MIILAECVQLHVMIIMLYCCFYSGRWSFIVIFPICC